MKIVRAMKEVSRLKGEIKEIKKRIESSLNAIEDNEFEEYYDDLQKVLSSKVKKVIQLKSKIMHANVKNGMFSVILNLGELKSYIEYLKELSPKSGLMEMRYRLDESVKYKTQMKISDRNKLIEETQGKINTLTDELDDFNAKTDIEEMDVAVRLF